MQIEVHKFSQVHSTNETSRITFLWVLTLTCLTRVVSKSSIVDIRPRDWNLKFAVYEYNNLSTKHLCTVSTCMHGKMQTVENANC
jgi:hypothetical protein